MLDMKAVLYKEQQEAEKARRDPVFAAERQSRRLVGIDVSKLKGRNQGVDARNIRDMQHVKVGVLALCAEDQDIFGRLLSNIPHGGLKGAKRTVMSVSSASCPDAVNAQDYAFCLPHVKFITTLPQ